MSVKTDIDDILIQHGVNVDNKKTPFEKLGVDYDKLADIIINTETFFFFVFNDDELDTIGVSSTIQDLYDIIANKIED